MCKKSRIFILITFTISFYATASVSGDWTSSGLNTYYTSGYVGLGTATPSNRLEIQSPTPWDGFIVSTPSNQVGYIVNDGNEGGQLALKQNGVTTVSIQAGGNSYISGGNFGLGTNSPGNRLEIQSASAWDGFIVSTPTNHVGYIVNDGNEGGQLALKQSGEATINFLATGVSFINGGNVGIGTKTPCADCKLAVNGKIQTKELVVIDTGWADYVFKDNYKLMTLKDVEAYIDDNGHLPGVPTASNVSKAGVNLGEMVKTLLEKVEELTLHAIALNKKNELLEQKIETLTK